MENPTFKLEGVIKSGDTDEDFEGPLTLILQLLSKNKIEIRDIQIAEILDQYLEYIDNMKAMDLDVASEFVSMASHLVYIKTKMLISSDEENTELEELISSLEALKSKDTYARISAVKDTLGEMFKRGGSVYTKPPEYTQSKEYKYVHDAADLSVAIARVLDKGEMISHPTNKQEFVMPQKVIYSVSRKTEEIMKRLDSRGVINTYTLFAECESRSEVVATFIALLELCKVGRIMFAGEGDNSTITALSESNVDDSDLSKQEKE